MRMFFWVGVVWLAYVFVGCPFRLTMIGMFGRVRPRIREDYLPNCSYPEMKSKDIRWKIRETLGWDYPADRIEVLVTSDASEDRTDRIVRNIKDGAWLSTIASQIYLLASRFSLCSGLLRTGSVWLAASRRGSAGIARKPVQERGAD